MNTNETIVIKEDKKSRNWLSIKILKAGVNVILKWWHISLGAILVSAILLYFLNIPKSAWPLILFLPTFPIIISLSCIIIHPFYAMPQTWILDKRLIKARGFRFIGAVKWSNVYEWHLENIHGLRNYYRLFFIWKKWKGLFCGKHSILISPSIPIEKVESYFKEYSCR